LSCAARGFANPAKVEVYLRSYPNLWHELSYRYGITNGNCQIRADWKRLFEKYPERFLIGSDTWIDSIFQFRYEPEGATKWVTR
jgi:hypothetical protein